MSTGLGIAYTLMIFFPKGTSIFFIQIDDSNAKTTLHVNRLCHVFSCIGISTLDIH
jgi:hypothetical protein